MASCKNDFLCTLLFKQITVSVCFAFHGHNFFPTILGIPHKIWKNSQPSTWSNVVPWIFSSFWSSPPTTLYRSHDIFQHCHAPALFIAADRLQTAMEPRYNKGSRDWQNFFTITRFHYIEVCFQIFHYCWGKENRLLYWGLRYSVYRGSLYQGSTVLLLVLENNGTIVITFSFAWWKQ